jgi:hypothetical protein
MRRAKKPWSAEEVALLQDMRGHVHRQDIAHLLERTKNSVASMLYLYGSQNPRLNPPTRWTREEEAFLIQNHRVLTNQRIADQLGKTRLAVRTKIRDLRLTKRSELPRRWTEADETYLLLAWQTDKLGDIAEALGRTIGAVLIRANVVLGVRRSPSYYVSAGQAWRLLTPELRELMALNTKLKKGLLDAEHRRLARAPLRGTADAASQPERG